MILVNQEKYGLFINFISLFLWIISVGWWVVFPFNFLYQDQEVTHTFMNLGGGLEWLQVSYDSRVLVGFIGFRVYGKIVTFIKQIMVYDWMIKHILNYEWLGYCENEFQTEGVCFMMVIWIVDWCLHVYFVVIVGEIANFAAYAFAPAILVTPLGALSIIFRYGHCSSLTWI